MEANGWRWALLLGVLISCSPPQTSQPAPNLLEPAILNRMVRSGEKLILINVMSQLECMDHSIPGSICIAGEELATEAPKLLPDKSRPLVFYCESNRCYRSAEAAAIAVKLGYQRVSVLRGGMPAWKRAGFDTVSQERIPRVPTESIKPEQLARLLVKRGNLLILDIRAEERFQEAHLPGAINIPLYRLHERYAEIPLNRPVLVVDDRGLRSFLVTCYLVRKGLSDVKRLFGGMEGWQTYTAPAKRR